MIEKYTKRVFVPSLVVKSWHQYCISTRITGKHKFDDHGGVGGSGVGENMIGNQGACLEQIIVKGWEHKNASDETGVENKEQTEQTADGCWRHEGHDTNRTDTYAIHIYAYERMNGNKSIKSIGGKT